MPWSDEGLESLGSFTRGLSVDYPTHMFFSSDDFDFNGSMVIGSLTDDSDRTAVTWSWNGKNPKFDVELSTNDGDGSIINSIGLTTTAGSGTGLLYTFDYSAIGSKNTTFNVQLSGELLFARPNTP